MLRFSSNRSFERVGRQNGFFWLVRLVWMVFSYRHNEIKFGIIVWLHLRALRICSPLYPHEDQKSIGIIFKLRHIIIILFSIFYGFCKDIYNFVDSFVAFNQRNIYLSCKFTHFVCCLVVSEPDEPVAISSRHYFVTQMEVINFTSGVRLQRDELVSCLLASRYSEDSPPQS